jgi:Carboxypeptidase regulatory-like domain
MKKLSFLFPILALLWVSCGKRNDTGITGQVTERGTGKPIANAKVIFSQCVSGDDFAGTPICIDIATTLTDAQGKYTFLQEDDKESDRYKIRVEKKHHFNEMPAYHLVNAKDKTDNVNFTMMATAWVKFHIKNQNPTDDLDKIFAPGSVSVSGPYIFLGKTIDTTYTLGNTSVGNFYFKGNNKNNIDWFVRKNGIIKQYQDSIFLQSLDTTFYEIKY